MTVAAPLWQVPEPTGAGFGVRLAGARAAVSGLATAADGLADMADDDVLAVMGELTSMTAQIDGLRVLTAAAVRDRDLVRRQGARNLTSWMRADPRTADDAWKLAQLATSARRLPRVLALLRAGQISLTQAGAACWQVSRLPDVPTRPEEAQDPADSTDAHGSGGLGDRCGDSGDSGDRGDGAAAQDQSSDPDDPSDPGDKAAPDWSSDPDEAWAGLWRAGDVTAAADELFSRFLPSLDPDQVRAMGAHLREAADVQERAGEECDDYAKRRLRISRTLGDAAEITGRLHAEAAEQVLAAFEELGAKVSPDDDRTKAQRWADVLAGLATGAAPLGQPAESADDQPGPDEEHLHGHQDTGGHRAPDGRQEQGSHQPQPQPQGEHRDSGPAEPAGAVPPPGLRRPRIIVTVPLSALLGRPLSPGGTLGSGAAITGHAARRLACDAEIVRIVTTSPSVSSVCACGHSPGNGRCTGNGQAGQDDRQTDQGDRQGDGQGLDTTGRLTELLANALASLPRPLGGPSAILDAGRKHPGWTPRQRDALHAQYGGHCGYPRCRGPIDVIHHVIHWTEGGPTAVWNGLPLCRYHHWLVHEGGWRLGKHPDGSVTVFPPPPGWRPGTIYRRGKPIRPG